MKTFIEFGTGRRADLQWLLLDGWKTQASGQEAVLGNRLVTYTNDWYGILVEPHPASLVELLDHMQYLGISLDRYQVFSEAITGTPREVSLHPVERDHFKQPDHAATLFNENSKQTQSLKSFSITLDRLLNICPYPVDLIRVDCEGAELEIFENFSFSPKPRHIIIEPHDWIVKGTTEGLISIFSEQGYTLQKTKDDAGVYLNFLL